jgi:hypothetical protein
VSQTVSYEVCLALFAFSVTFTFRSYDLYIVNFMAGGM